MDVMNHDARMCDDFEMADVEVRVRLSTMVPKGGRYRQWMTDGSCIVWMNLAVMGIVANLWTSPS